MTGLLRRCSLALALLLAFTAGEVQARGIYPHGTPLLLLALAAVIVGANLAANSMTRAERRQHRSTRRQVRRLERDLADMAGERDLWKTRCFRHIEARAVDHVVMRETRLEIERHRAGVTT